LGSTGNFGQESRWAHLLVSQTNDTSSMCVAHEMQGS
jgi:hypothetical protein